MRDLLKVFVYFAVATVLATLLYIGLALLGYAALPAFFTLQTRAQENSPQFVISAQKDITTAMYDYDALQKQIDDYSSDSTKAKVVEDMKQQQSNDVCDARTAAQLMQSDIHPERLTSTMNKFFDRTSDVVCR